MRRGDRGPRRHRVEVPAAALMADALALEVDFLNIRTNDLIQYAMAAERTSSELADLGTAFEPAVLRLIEQVCDAARDFNRRVAVCGEAAADPLRSCNAPEHAHPGDCMSGRVAGTWGGTRSRSHWFSLGENDPGVYKVCARNIKFRSAISGSVSWPKSG